MSEFEVPPAPRPARTKRWLGLIVGSLIAAFVTVAALQWRQFTLLNDTVRYDSDNIVWSFYQLETETLKLRQTLHQIDADPSTFDRDALQLRYDVFVSRIALVNPTRTAAHMRTQATQADTVARVNAFVATADAYLGPHPFQRLDVAAARSLLRALEPLMEPVQDMAAWANDAMASRVGDRNDAVRQQNRISIALMALQVLLIVVFTVVALRQFHALLQRGSALESLAARLHAARREAEAASRTKSAFLANMSHELRTPFQGVLGMLALIEGGPLNTQQADQLRTARESATHLLSLLNDVLDLSTLEHGKLKLVPVPTALHHLLEEVEALMGSQARTKGLTLHLHRDATVPAHVLADATRLKQILFNLIGNAVKFTDSGSVRVDVDTRVNAAAAAMLHFAVADTGVGIDAGTQARLFQRFSQGDDSSSRRFGGTGLGLEISRNLALMMGGDIDVVSTPGRGSRFTLRVPLQHCGPPERAVAAAGSVSPTPPLRVLVVEDHPVNRKYLHALLIRLGHTVTLSENGQLALDHAGRETYDVVLMDMHMPVMDGLAATLAIRALPAPHGAVPILALTADAFPDTRARAAQAGTNDFLAKPVQPADLEQALSRLFSAAAPPARVPGPAATDPATSAWLDLMVPQQVFGSLPPPLHGRLLLHFFSDDSGSLARLLDRLDAADGGTVRQAAHALRGAALNLGLSRLADTLVAIEAAAQPGPMADAGDWRQRVLDELTATHEACLAAGWISATPNDTAAA